MTEINDVLCLVSDQMTSTYKTYTLAFICIYLVLCAACVPWAYAVFMPSTQSGVLVGACGEIDGIEITLTNGAIASFSAFGPPYADKQIISIVFYVPPGKSIQLTSPSVLVTDITHSREYRLSIHSIEHKYLEENRWVAHEINAVDKMQGLALEETNKNPKQSLRHNFYKIALSLPVPLPDRFNLQLSPVLLDGVLYPLNVVSFTYRKRLTVKALMC